MARLLVAGGAGFIGSHTCVVLLEAGHELVVLDDFSNSSPVALERVAELAGVPLGGEQLQLMQVQLPPTLHVLPGTGNHLKLSSTCVKPFSFLPPWTEGLATSCNSMYCT